MDEETLARFDAELAVELHRRFLEDPLAVDHRIFALSLEKPQGRVGTLSAARA